MKRFSYLALALALTACSSTNSSATSGVSSGGSASADRAAAAPEGSGGGASSSSGASAAPSQGGAASDPVGSPAPASVLTAGVWDDNRNLDRFLSFRASLVGTGQAPGLLPFTEAEHRAAHGKFAQTGAKQKLDVSLVLDATGSMGDEIRYLQSEFAALSDTLGKKYPNAEQRWSLVVYRDKGDQFVTRVFDFRSDLAEYRAKLMEQGAAGGGDFPEALAEGLQEAAGLSWRGDEAAKLAFVVADAPHHDENAKQTGEAIKALASRGVHVYPVASSGVDEFTELTLRQTAQLTGGRYIFLTDDSGIGGAHKEPSIPCYFVTKLDKAITRMVDIEMTGQYKEPEAADVIRAGGKPQAGECKLESGATAIAY